MITELRKSLSSILYERTSSPFYGSLIASWLVWNWEIIYLTLFVSESSIKVTKIELIKKSYSSFDHLVYYPVISALVILTLVPFLSNGAYWLHIKFKKWKTDQKNAVEMKTLLTMEQSIQLRQDLLEAEVQLDSLLDNKEQEINRLNLQIKNLTEMSPKTPGENISTDNTDLNSASKIVNKILESKDLRLSLETVVEYIQGGFSGLTQSDNVSKNALAFFEANQMIKGEGKGVYSLTDMGRDVLKGVLDAEY